MKVSRARLRHSGIVTLCLLVVPFCQGFAQDFEDISLSPMDIEWSDGKIELNDGVSLKGLIQFNDKTGILSFEEGGNRRSFTARTVAAFEYFDHGAGKRKFFLSLPFEDSHSGAKRPLFFEVLKEFESFAVLLKKDPVEVNQLVTHAPGTPLNNENAMTNSNTIVRVHQLETIYFMSSSAEIDLYLEIENREINGMFGQRSRTKQNSYNESILKKYLGTSYGQIQAYKKENNLKFNVKEDFLRLMEYYETLVKN